MLEVKWRLIETCCFHQGHTTTPLKHTLSVVNHIVSKNKRVQILFFSVSDSVSIPYTQILPKYRSYCIKYMACSCMSSSTEKANVKKNQICVFLCRRYFLICVNYFFYGETVADYFGALVQREEPLQFLARYHRFISFALYLAGGSCSQDNMSVIYWKKSNFHFSRVELYVAVQGKGHKILMKHIYNGMGAPPCSVKSQSLHLVICWQIYCVGQSDVFKKHTLICGSLQDNTTDCKLIKRGGCHVEWKDSLTFQMNPYFYIFKHLHLQGKGLTYNHKTEHKTGTCCHSEIDFL